MVVLNDLDRYHLAMDVVDRVACLSSTGVYPKQEFTEKLIQHRQYLREHGEDMPEIRDWKWTGKRE